MTDLQKSILGVTAGLVIIGLLFLFLVQPGASEDTENGFTAPSLSLPNFLDSGSTEKEESGKIDSELNIEYGALGDYTSSGASPSSPSSPSRNPTSGGYGYNFLSEVVY